jgi:glycosyltransferase involved in cell wall biosynthesis
MVTPEISIVIPARNEGISLLRAVESIIAGRSECFPLEIVIVDDASTEDHASRSVAGFHAPGRNVFVNVVRLPQWSGIPYARNTGASLATADLLFITDANVLFPRCWDRFLRHPSADARSGRRVRCAAIADLDSSFTGYGCALQLPSLGVGWLTSPRAWGGYVPVAPCSSTVISSALFRELGGYDTAMPLYGAAEPEFSVRLWLSGAEIVSVPSLVLKHWFRPVAHHTAFLVRHEELLTRNYLRFALLYLQDDLLTRVLHHYASARPKVFAKALSAVATRQTWERRNALQNNLRYSFADYLRIFPGLPGAN